MKKMFLELIKKHFDKSDNLSKQFNINNLKKF